MKRLLLATVACLALSSPAIAQNSPQGAQGATSSPQQQNQPANVGADQMQGQKSSPTQANNNHQQGINPAMLDKQAIAEIQANLNKAGFSAKRVDGMWGRETRDALRDFQHAKNLPGNGELNQQTLAALNVTIPNEGRAASEPNKSGGSPQHGPAGQAQPTGNSPSPPSGPTQQQ
jgi:murein L,D-transpeptidase YcbB/YkuD